MNASRLPSVAGAILAEPAEIQALLLEAQGARCAIVTRQALRMVEGKPRGGADLRTLLRELRKGEEGSAGCWSRFILGEEGGAADLGHAPAWMDAGSSLESLLKEWREGGPIDFIFCQDPWSAQLLGRVNELGPGVRWILVSDLDTRRRESPHEYWNRLEEWFGTLPFHAVIPEDAWKQALLSEGQSLDSLARRTLTDRVHLERLGAWQWTRISPMSPAPPKRDRTILLIVKYNGSLAHLRVFLDSLVRQTYRRDSFRTLIVGQEIGGDLENYLKWLFMAHPGIGVVPVRLGANEEALRRHATQFLEEDPSATVVFLDDHAVLANEFARECEEQSTAKSEVTLTGMSLSLEATAHIITGNLDPVLHYTQLWEASRERDGRRAAAIGRIIPGRAWRTGGGDPIARLFKGAGTPGEPEPPRSIRLLRLGDSP